MPARCRLLTVAFIAADRVEIELVGFVFSLIFLFRCEPNESEETSRPKKPVVEEALFFLSLLGNEDFWCLCKL